jgi:hypothetical protein
MTDMTVAERLRIEGITRDGGGLRYDTGKERLDLIPSEWPWALALVLSVGASKYEERNWEKGMKWSKMVSCALRHFYKFVAGERFDQESGIHHLAHAAWNILALMSYDIRGLGKDDIVSNTSNLLERLKMT